MHQNSLLAYESIKPLNPKQQQVLDVMRGKMPLTRQDIAFLLKWEINSVCGRVKELIDSGRIEECGNRKGPNGVKRATLRIRE
jgi:DNA-binding MarR family transcriptional regulator